MNTKCKNFRQACCSATSIVKSSHEYQERYNSQTYRASPEILILHALRLHNRILIKRDRSLRQQPAVLRCDLRAFLYHKLREDISLNHSKKEYKKRQQQANDTRPNKSSQKAIHEVPLSTKLKLGKEFILEDKFDEELFARHKKQTERTMKIVVTLLAGVFLLFLYPDLWLSFPDEAAWPIVISIAAF